jgi:hypothetical protein
MYNKLDLCRGKVYLLRNICHIIYDPRTESPGRVRRERRGKEGKENKESAWLQEYEVTFHKFPLVRENMYKTV